MNNRICEEIKVSIIVPIYNVEEYLRDCLNSIIVAKKKVKSEVLLIDDGSTDKSSIIAKTYAMVDDQIKYYRVENGGQSKARNLGLKFAQGEYISFIDGDDIIAPDYYINMLESAKEYNPDISVSNIIRFDKKRKWYSPLQRHVFNNVTSSLISIYDNTELVYDTNVTNKIYKRTFLQENNLLFPEGVVFEDLLFSLQVYCLSKKTSYIKEVGYLWRKRDSQCLSTTQQNMSLKNLTDRVQIYHMMFSFLNTLDKNVSNVRDALVEKILINDLPIYINECISVDAPHRDEYYNLLKEFIIEHFDNNDFSKLGILLQNKYDYFLKKDFDKLTCLLNYEQSDYNNDRSSILYQTTDLEELTSFDDFIVKREYSNYVPMHSINSISLENGSFVISGFIFCSGINVESVDNQQIKVFLVNNINAQSIELSIDRTYDEKIQQIILSVCKNKNVVDYSYATFHATIDPLELDDKDNAMLGKNFLQVNYANRYCEGAVLARTLNTHNQKMYSNLELSSNCFNMITGFDIGGQLYFEIKKK